MLTEGSHFSTLCMKTYHQFLYGRYFTLTTNCTVTLSPKKGVNQLTAAHMQQLARLLLAYNVHYHPINVHNNADSLPHLPQKHSSMVGKYNNLFMFNFAEFDVLVVESYLVVAETHTN